MSKNKVLAKFKIKAYICDDCDRAFRTVDDVTLHLTETGHQNWSISGFIVSSKEAEA